MHHGQALLTRLLLMRGRRNYYEQLERVNRESDQERTVQARRGNMEGVRMDSTVHTLSGHNGKAQSV
jgi:hypothetical protein